MFRLSFLIGLILLAMHGNWHDRYSTAGGVPCCGPHDCTMAHVRVLEMGNQTMTIEINGEQVVIPARSFHQSEDSHDWWCAADPAKPIASWNTRCVFLAVGS